MDRPRRIAADSAQRPPSSAWTNARGTHRPSAPLRICGAASPADAEARDAQPPRGVYLWGGVGRGKTLIMDLFFDTLTTTDRRRTHFHRFMHELHVELGRLKHRANPLEVVAHRIARARAYLLRRVLRDGHRGRMLLGTLFAGLFRRGVALVATSKPAARRPLPRRIAAATVPPGIELIEANVDVVTGGSRRRLPAAQLERAKIYQ